MTAVSFTPAAGRSGTVIRQSARPFVGREAAPAAGALAPAQAPDYGLHERDPPRVLGRLARAARELALQDQHADRGARALPGRSRGRGAPSGAARESTKGGARCRT